MEVEILHTTKGDKKRSIDTKTEAGRQEAAILLNRLMKDGMFVVLERGKKAYRIKGYDAKKDTLLVSVDTKAGVKQVGASGKKGKTTAVPPIAGGVNV